MLAKITPMLFVALLWCPLTLLAESEGATTDAVFHIECPDDVTVDCDAEIWDLSAYGWAYVYGYGAPVPADDPVVSYHLNSCGTGHIARTWTAYDYQNNPHSCTQYIYVGGGGFTGYNIHWPPNYMTTECYADLDPDDLPPPYDYPTYDDLDCSMIMIGYDDLVFDFGGGCKKILRTWSVLDWCTYNPNYPNGGGRWDYTQVIKVKPNGGIVLTCPDDVEASAGQNCSGTYVTIPPATGIGACGGPVQVTNNSPYASTGGADASGHYPYGETWVTFTAEDACGNWESCKIKVIVRDMKKPSPICYNGLTANLMMNADGYYMDLDAEWFNKGSFDNCTPEHLLRFRIEPSRFTCDQLGEQDVRVYVMDLDGNEQYCNTYVIIQDNMGMCPPEDTTTFTLSGNITNVQGSAVQGIEIELMEDGDMLTEVSSDATGNFEFTHVVNSLDYMVMPRGNDDYALGLSTFDLLKLAKHIYGVKLLNSDAEMLAADANQDGEVNVQDLLVLRKLLLNYRSNLPNNKAWRFIPTDLLTDNPDDPLNMDFDEYWQISNLYENFSDIDFTAIKIGDINGSVQGIGSGEERNANPQIQFEATQSGNTIEIKSTKNITINGFQWELSIGNNMLLDIIPGKMSISSTDVRMLNSSSLFSWFLIEDEVAIESGDVLFSLVLEDDTKLDLELLNEFLAPELYSVSEVNYEVKLTNGANDQHETLNQNEVVVYPNPIKGNNPIQIISLDSEIQKITIYNSQGQVKIVRNNVGQNEFGISTRDFQPGLYLIEVKTIDGESSMKKLVLE